MNMKLHMIGNAHLDPVWLWDWTEGYHEVKATFRSALDRMKEFPDFVFTCSAAAYYAWIEEDEPEMFQEIRQRVEEGRWAIVGGWWIQPDCNAPCGESFARQGLVGQRYFESRFGRRAHCGYNVDSFGHNGSLPQILKLSGMDAYVFMRPMKHERELPANIFRWRSADGSRVDAFRIPVAYCTWQPDLRERMEACVQELPKDSSVGMGFYGVGNHGGGPTVENIRCIQEMQKTWDLEFSDPDRFFRELRGQNPVLPEVEGELLHHASGCYSAHSGVKMWNRRSENALLAAEKWSVIAQKRLARRYPAEKLDAAWKRVLFNQFHDILAGTSLESAYEDARNQYGEALAIAQDAANSAMQAISWRIGIPMEDGVQPIVAFNPNAFDAVQQYSMQIACASGGTMTDAQGKSIPCQLADPSPAVGGRKTLLFEAEIPAMGYRLLKFRPCDASEAPVKQGLVLENQRLRAEISPETGLLTSLVRKLPHGGAEECLNGASSRGVVIRDTSDTWSHGVFRYPDVEGEFRLDSVVRTESGPVRECVVARFSDGKSTMLQKYMLWSQAEALEISVSVDWHEHSRMLKLAYFPAGDTAKTAAEIPFGMAVRPADGIEYPMQTWVRMGGLTLINDGKFAYDAQDGSLRLTVLRSPRYAHHHPYVPSEDSDFPFMDQGEQRFTLWLRPGTEQTSAQASMLGQQWNQRPYALLETFHPGTLPESDGYLSVTGALLTAMKLAEDGSPDMVLHLYEANGCASEAEVRILGKTFRLHLHPWEIAALRIGEDGCLQRVNLLEEPLGKVEK